MVIKAASITNLTDARFFAAQGVDYLGFCFDPQSPDYISPQDASAIKGWISGPKIVAEFANQDAENMKNIISFIEPDAIEIIFNEISKFNVSEFGKPVILKTSIDQLSAIDRESYLFFIVDDFDKSTEQMDYPIVVDITGKFVDAEKLPVYGIQISGTREDEIGVKDYDAIADLLERLK